ncbi:MAG: tRNA (adenosine(37)-N6)-dimethylallyltransferase MiaA [Alphaproteobacteria bacterium RIFCSPHIGHO2_02_FULL_46_13]|nr:MAG: tRNA (adenosine(37)-N6)-dimethylallyltransferase MiaA [Alphaproteobacteria bacterium RIFCSPHIGHO2_02_FULL_46_13]
MNKKTVNVIAGPTASGKSAHALTLAEKIGGVIINADSLQLYNGLPTLTAQPSAADKALVPHLLYGITPPDITLTAMDWRKMALAALETVTEDGKVPIIVGGTGFYIKTLMEGLSPIPEIPNEVRILSEDLMDQLGIEAFFEQLKTLDPVLCEKIDPQNRRRLVRAYEVIAHTGKPMSYWQSFPPVGAPDQYDFQVQIISPDRDTLYDRCNTRFDIMVASGVVDEVRHFDDLIMAGKVPFDCALTHALGFQPLQSHVRGEMDLDTAIILSKNETRHYAKRQTTWFKNQM